MSILIGIKIVLTGFFLLVKICQKVDFKNLKMKFFSRFSITVSENSQSSPNFYVWFSICSQNYEIMIKDLYFMCGL